LRQLAAAHFVDQRCCLAVHFVEEEAREPDKDARAVQQPEDDDDRSDEIAEDCEFELHAHPVFLSWRRGLRRSSAITACRLSATAVLYASIGAISGWYPRSSASMTTRVMARCSWSILRSRSAE